MKPLRFLVVLALMLAACGGSGGDDTTTTGGGGDGTTTTTADDGNGDGGGSVDIDDIPQECLDAFADFLRAIEPAVEDFDFENATFDDLETLSTDLEPITASYEDTIGASSCDDLDLDASDDEAFEFMIEFARDEAPGTVGYFEWIRDFASGFDPGSGSGDDGGSAATGDCEDDIAALMVFVDSGSTMSDLPIADLSTVGQLMTSISTACPSGTVAELFADPDVTAFLESG